MTHPPAPPPAAPVQPDVRGPTLGRIVHFRVSDGPVTVHAAMVIGVSAEGAVMLRVFRHPHLDYVVHDVPYSSDPKPGHWSWPPRAP